MNVEDYNQEYWEVCDKELLKSEICVAIKDVLQISMQDDMEYKDKDYWYFPQK